MHIVNGMEKRDTDLSQRLFSKTEKKNAFGKQGI